MSRDRQKYDALIVVRNYFRRRANKPLTPIIVATALEKEGFIISPHLVARMAKTLGLRRIPGSKIRYVFEGEPEATDNTETSLRVGGGE